MTPDERRQIEQAILGRDATSAARALEPIIDAMLADRDAKIARFADLLATSSKNGDDALSMTNELAFTERDLPQGWERGVTWTLDRDDALAVAKFIRANAEEAQR